MAKLNQLAKSQQFLTNNKAVKEILDKVAKLALTAYPILITGDTGTGKTELARHIHNLSDRSQEPFMHINCAAIPDTLIEAELFGYVKGAFTGAYTDTEGKIAAAGRGTLLLDEIGEIPLHLQAKLLRVIDENQYLPIGKTAIEHVNARIIAATNKNLVKAVEERNFREDLYYRLNIFEIILPSLKERPEDIPLHFDHFVELHRKKHNLPPFHIHPLVYEALKEYHWPGNTREIKNFVERLLINSDRNIELQHLDTSMLSTIQGQLIKHAQNYKSLDEIKKVYTKYILKICENNKKKAARILQIDVKTVRKLLE